MNTLADRGLPSITVAVCTRDRTDLLADCLASLVALDPQPLEILVVDNAPRSNATAELTATFPQIRYLCEPQPGLNRARNRAIAAAQGDIIAFIDDDVVVSPQWVGAIAAAFANDTAVAAVTGLVEPYELETDAQRLFEQYGGFGRGSQPITYRVHPKSGYRFFYHGTGQMGTGANMAFRRTLFADTGLFDPALDVGTPTNGGGDLDLFFRVLKHGHTHRYEPQAVVYHRHRRTYAELRRQLTNNGVGFYAYLVRNWLAYPDERLPLLLLGIWWFLFWNIGRLLNSLLHPNAFPRDLILAELRGCFVGLTRYQLARKQQLANTAVPLQEAPIS